MISKILKRFSSQEIEEIGRETGFVKKTSKFRASDFLTLLLFNSEQSNNVSLNQLAIEFGLQSENTISKQGIDKRFNAKAVLFIKSILEKYLKEEVLKTSLPIGWSELFNRIRIKDGTRFILPEKLADHLKGFGGSKGVSKAGACIQYEFDLKNGEVLDLEVTSANVPDSRNAQITKDKIEKGDLILRDLGYFGLNIIKEIKAKEAFIISKLNTKTAILIRKNKQVVPLKLKYLYRLMLIRGQKSLEMEVLIGKEEQIPIRLILEIMPDEVYEKRIKEIEKHNKKKGFKTSEEYKTRSRFNLTITNVEEEKMPKEAITSFYRLRWQIELMFKVWKSNYQIDQTRSMKYERYMCLLYARLLLVMVHWDIIRALKVEQYQKEGKLLSVMKCFQTLRISSTKIKAMIGEKRNKIKEIIHNMIKSLSKNHWIERKKKSINEENIFYLSYCKSGYYVYI